MATAKFGRVAKWTTWSFVFFVFLGFALYYALLSGLLRFNYPSRTLYPIRGIDVSHHQGKVGWKKIREAGVTFVYLKATEGGDHVDRRFADNWRDAQATGLIVGAYHFYTFCRDGATQATNFLRAVPNTNNSLPMAIDLEFGGNCRNRPSAGDIIRELEIFITLINTHDKRKPVLYMTKEFYKAYAHVDKLFDEHPLWIRDIYRTPNWLGSRTWTLWQYANRGRIAGIKGPVDLNVFFGNQEQWQQFLRRAE